ncbi:hypothetical protein ACFGVS_04325 [Mucilaginibacter sp. AW1-7]|uniref:hypothetical protein n=1 Tax=unclassified Mucilaginibacter TaxID=2617802 RepID=UPI00236530B4|nr:hypothetical protein [Mucilaginibacter sp. KACC 22773]WDF80955.1 hypothetical protein PQ469_13165 [Mucilaginibacter sp. KACC 22773]
MRKYGELNQNQGNDVWIRGTNVNADMTTGNHTLERNGPNRKNLKVLHEDGSFADLPDRDIPGAGALSGCITK